MAPWTSSWGMSLAVPLPPVYSSISITITCHGLGMGPGMSSDVWLSVCFPLVPQLTGMIWQHLVLISFRMSCGSGWRWVNYCMGVQTQSCCVSTRHSEFNTSSPSGKKPEAPSWDLNTSLPFARVDHVVVVAISQVPCPRGILFPKWLSCNSHRTLFGFESQVQKVTRLKAHATTVCKERTHSFKSDFKPTSLGIHPRFLA